MTVLRMFRLNELGSITLAATLYLAVAGLALAPSAVVPSLPGFSDKGQHVLAFFCLAVVSIQSTPQPIRSWRVCTTLLVFAAALEFGQILSPSRSVSLADFIASALGTVSGVMLAEAALRLKARHATSRLRIS